MQIHLMQLLALSPPKYAHVPMLLHPEPKSFLGIKEFAYRSVDLRVQWDAKLGGDLNLAVIGEATNVFNYANDACFDGWAGAPGEPNPNFGTIVWYKAEQLSTGRRDAKRNFNAGIEPVYETLLRAG